MMNEKRLMAYHLLREGMIMREDILKETNYTRISENIKPNFSTLTARFHASRNTDFYLKEGEPPKKRNYSSM